MDFVNLFQRWVVLVLWRYELVLLAAQTNVVLNVRMLLMMDRIYRSDVQVALAAYVWTKFADIFSLGVTKQLFCKIYQMLIRNTQ